MGADTGPADSVDTDLGPPTAATLGLTVLLGGVEVAAAGATPLGSTSLPSNSLRAHKRVKWKAIIDNEDKKLSYRRVIARCVLSVVILPIATQQCRNYLYDKS